ncbi:hypothetical protein E1281_21410 [Actinomadura sp. KC345]|uniref:hypothetical protein n=1 Tax=Actinomadura sp. KC345 TaxID=2530371 RepID=UPI0010D038F8|nr:hypothetical protein [Actinomadura sp. KC345]TDC50787.1 hypothetical protein E1281_21410 [Actinomadura sp. KC345]
MAKSLVISAKHLPHYGPHINVAALREPAEAPPSWLLQARAEIELQRAATEVIRQDEVRREAVLDWAAKATSRLD